MTHLSILYDMQLPNLTDKQKSPKEPITGTLGKYICMYGWMRVVDR